MATKLIKYLPIQLPWTMLVGIGQSETLRCCLYAEVLKLS